MVLRALRFACLGFLLARSAAAAPPTFVPTWSFPDHNGVINASIIYNDHLYLGGTFTVIGGINASCVVEWDGQQYHALGTGIDSSNTSTRAVKAFAVSNSRLVVAGNFTTAGGVTAGSVAAWDSVTRTWTTLGGGLGQVGGTPADVRALKVASVGGGPMTLYAGGFFNLADNQPVLNVAAWTGTMWNNAGGGYNGSVNALEAYNGALYAGGTGSSSNRFRVLPSPAGPWVPVPGGTVSGNSARINTLRTFDNGRLLAVGGSFTTLGTATTTPNLAYLQDTSYVPSCQGIGDAITGVTCITTTVDGPLSTLAVGGGHASHVTLVDVDDTHAPNIPASICTEPNPLAGTPNTLCSFVNQATNERDLFAGGSFFLVQTPGMAWTSPGDGVSGQFSVVNSLCAGAGPTPSPRALLDTLYIAGVMNAYVNVQFAYPISVARQMMARQRCLDNLRNISLAAHRTVGTPLGEGMNGIGMGVSAWTDAEGPYVAVCGTQTSAGNLPANGLSFYRPVTGAWSSPSIPAHSGSLDNFVAAVLSNANARFFAGDFSNTGTAGLDFFGGLNSNNAVVPVLCGPNAAVRGCRRSRSNPVSATRWGDYPSVSCPPQNTGFIDSFNLITSVSTPWPGDPLNGSVFTTCETGQESALPGLYAGGAFTAAGSTILNHIAYWNGAAWEPLGLGVNGNVNAMALWDDGEGVNLYVGGTFTAAGGQTASRLARWDGAQWSPVLAGGTEDGANNTVSAMTVIDFDDDNGPSLMIGGAFTRAGGFSSGRLAQLIARGVPVIAMQPPAHNAVAPGAPFTLSLRAYRSPPLAYQWRRNNQDLSDGPHFAGTRTPTLSVAAADSADNATYACVVTNSFGSVTSSNAQVSVGSSCPADFNSDGDLNPDDLGDFITCYFGVPPCPGADFNADGEINPDDLGDFITAYFQGCP